MRGRAALAMALPVLGAGAAVLAGSKLRNWGTTAGELAATHAGDDLVAGPVRESTYAVTVDAPPEAVWPWLVQIGQDRGGMYSYTWLENLAGLGIRNADEIRPEWQRLAVGDRVQVVPPGRLGLPDGYAFRVQVVDPPTALVLRQQPPEHPWDATWAFLVEPSGQGRCRLIARSREARAPGAAGRASGVASAAMAPVVLLMTRKMLLGMKERAERSTGPAARTPSFTA